MPTFLAAAREKTRDLVRASSAALPDSRIPEEELDRVARAVGRALGKRTIPERTESSLLAVRLLDLLRAEVFETWPEAGDGEPAAGRPSAVEVARAFETVRRACLAEPPGALGAPLLDPWAREILSEVAHTLGSSFSSIVFLAELLLQTSDSPDPVRARQLRLLQSAALTLGTTAGDLLRLAGPLEEPEEPAGPDAPTVGDVLRKVATALQPSAEERGVEILSEAAAQDERVSRSFLLTRLVLSLALALTAEGEGGRLAIRVREDGGGVLSLSLERDGLPRSAESEGLLRIFPGRDDGEGFAFSTAGAAVAAARRVLRSLGSDLRREEPGPGCVRLAFPFPLR